MAERSNWHAFDERWTLLARTVDLCYEAGARQVRNDQLCEPMRQANPGRRVQFAGAIKQHVGTTPIRAAASYRPSPIRSIDFADYFGLHTPN